MHLLAMGQVYHYSKLSLNSHCAVNKMLVIVIKRLYIRCYEFQHSEPQQEIPETQDKSLQTATSINIIN